MTTYQHILAAIDYSQDDTIIVAKARKLADLFSARISYVHVLDNIPMPDTGYGTRIPFNENSDNILLEQEKQHFAEHMHSLNIDPKQCLLIWGNPAEEITAFAAEEQIGLIVIGAHHKSALARLISSTSDGVLHHSPCDLLAVHLT